MSGDLKKFILERNKTATKGYEGIFEMGEWEGLHNTLSLFYPDTAHFVFELLQNAEDAGASKVRFDLLNESLIFKHNGTKDFNEQDIKSITGIGSSTKKEDTNTIGKFGVGFKSVFVYTTTPQIYSKSINFKIENLFIPSLIEPKSITKGYTTLFVFPFDRDDKPKEDAYREVKKLFDELSDNVLLFLTNINTLEWQISNSKTHKITKEKNNELVTIKNTQKETIHWLVFDKANEYEGVDKPLTLSIAFKFNKIENEIVPIKGDVSIFFPAKKEFSNLKFHVDAPFSSTVARDSIIDSTENDEIMEGIVALCRESMSKIRDQGLLTPTFFEVLPNNEDVLDLFYQPIFDGFVKEFSSRDNKLMPLRDGTFGRIHKSIYCPKEVSDTFLEKNDINILFNEEKLDGFAITPDEDSRFEVFLTSLDGLVEYEDYEVFDRIYEIASNISKNSVEEMEEEVKEYDYEDDIQKLDLAITRRKWLKTKSNEYLQSMYAYLYETIENYSSRFGASLDGSDDNYNHLYHLLKFKNGKFNYENLKCYFLDESSKSKSDLNFVHPAVFSSGKSKNKQQKAKSFLKRIGVEDVGESTHIEYLFYKYKFVSETSHLRDINRLVKWYLKEQKNNPNDEVDLKKIDLHRESFVNTESAGLLRADQTYIDDPYQLTGLRYIGYLIHKSALHSSYNKLENTKIFIEILTRLGSVNSLKISRSDIADNHDWERLWRDSKGRVLTHTGASDDWNIDGLSEMLELDENRREISLLIWNTVSSQVRKNHLLAVFQMSRNYNPVTAKSQLIFNLMVNKWIPDKKGNFYKPEDIDEKMLADEFSFNEASLWLDAVGFGKNILIQKKEYKQSQAALGEWGIPLGAAEEIKNSGLSEDEINEAIRERATKKLRDSMEVSAKGGSTSEVSHSEGLGSIITNPRGHQANVAKENEGVSGSKTPGVRNITRQDPEQLKKIDNFLYEEYSGHCQVCGDTFEGNNGRNVFMTHSLNRSKKGDRLKSDVNRKGNSICLCPKHHLIFFMDLQAFNFIDKFEKSDLSLETIKQNFEFREDVGNAEGQEYEDFYNSPKESSFERDVYMLPITLFGNRFYLKFTQDHIQQFIEVWNNN
ncbi:hypothetical protein OAE24_05300 [Candidatus Thioglobus sp.]|nr:hypothetical protein [Candidatus Thioglobus sp.]